MTWPLDKNDEVGQMCLKLYFPPNIDILTCSSSSRHRTRLEAFFTWQVQEGMNTLTRTMNDHELKIFHRSRLCAHLEEGVLLAT